MPKRIELSGKRYGIDRLDNNKGYSPNNVVTCCFQCNRAKNNKDAKDFINWAIKIAQRCANEVDNKWL